MANKKMCNDYTHKFNSLDDSEKCKICGFTIKEVVKKFIHNRKSDNKQR